MKPLIVIALLLIGLAAMGAARAKEPAARQERTSFQTSAPWDGRLHLGSDVAICYGVGPDIGARIAQWKAQGYSVHVMTGASWGNYQDYLYGRFDGKNHVDEGQKDVNGHVMSHGGDIYYMCPGENYGKFLCVGIKRAIDAGADAIHLEEPEYWIRSGYEEGFKREWKARYQEDWIAPHTSPDAQFRASQLKYYLYRRALKQVFDFVRDYNRQTGRHVRCYVPTHSLLNYAQWGIVSPESSLMQVGADGYIAQVWTGTARTPNTYNGVTRERTFETAFLEYGSMMNVARATNGTVWFLNDPIEDDPDHSWTDYRRNWESTLTASLLWPQVSRYEVMPWPERIFHGEYPKVDRAQRSPGAAVEKEPLPAVYGTELLTVINALNEMKQANIAWDCGTRGIGILVSDTLMFQRGEPSAWEPTLSSFYGLAMPLVKRGMPLEPVQLENVTLSGSLRPYKVLLLTYEGMKPMTAEVHIALAKWVRAGGVLIYIGDDTDPYNGVRAWWNTPPNAYASPREPLFRQLGVPPQSRAGNYDVGAGKLLFFADSPARLARSEDGGRSVCTLVETACRFARLPYVETNYLALRRGPYVVAAGLDESLPAAPHVLRGHFVNLFDANLAALETVTLTPESRHLLLDLDAARRKSPAVLAAACKVTRFQASATGCRFHAVGPEGTEAVACLALSHPPVDALLDNRPLPMTARTWDAATHTLRLHFPNAASGHDIVIEL